MAVPRSSRVARCVALCRYHRPIQFLRRTLAIVRRRLPLDVGAAMSNGLTSLPSCREGVPFNQWLRAKTDAVPHPPDGDFDSIPSGKFTLLSQRHDLGFPIDWRCDSVAVSHLWRFHLHYHEFLLGLVLSAPDPAEADERFAAAWRVVEDWMRQNRPNDRRTRLDAWHPFCISKRLPVWMLLWTARRPEGDAADAVLASMFAQARFLASHLERDLGGNHLLENLRTLILAGAFFSGPEAERWLDRGIRLFRREVKEQFLPSGEHFERAPMYHAIMLDMVLDLRDLLAEIRPEFARECGELAARMGGFLRGIVHPDGEIPLLGDSAFGEAPPTPAILARVEERPSGGPAEGARCVGDYWSFRDGDDFLLFDRGPVGADHLPAHAHADLLAFEASLGGRRVFVDSGVFNYEDDSMRAYCRGSAAHNVLMIDEVDQCDVWSKFRMGYRGHPSELEKGAGGDLVWASARHDAYRRLGVPRVERLIACRCGGPWFFIDSADGAAEHVFTSRFHLHPDVEPVPAGDDAVEFDVDGRRYLFRCVGAAGVEVEPAWYCPRFGERRPARAVVYRQTGVPPLRVAWCLDPKDSRGTARWISPRSFQYEDSRRVIEVDVPSRTFNTKEKSLG